MYTSRVSAVILSRGSQWNPKPWEPPFLLPDEQPWPAVGGTAQVVFYDSSGGTIATIAGTLTGDAILFDAPPSVVDQVPAGAGFEIFITDNTGATYQVRYGTVVRREATFLSPPSVAVASNALQFTDSFPTLGLRSTWVPVAGTTAVQNNSAASLPNGVGPNENLFGIAQSAIRWYQPLNGDSCQVQVAVVNMDTSNLLSDKTTIIFCADQNLTTYYGVQFEVGTASTANQIHFLTGNGDPFTWTYQGTSIANTVANGDVYTIGYNNGAGTISVFKNGGTSPLGSWTDNTKINAHGPGYRYQGMSFVNQALENGVQVTSWQAMDSI